MSKFIYLCIASNQKLINWVNLIIITNAMCRAQDFRLFYYFIILIVNERADYLSNKSTSGEKMIFLFNFPDDLLTDSNSFIYGQSPSTGNVPIYAMVTICDSLPVENEQDGNDQKAPSNFHR